MTQNRKGQSVTFAVWLAAARTERQWSQEKLAEEAGISVKTVSAIEQGRIVDPRISTADKLFSALGLSFFPESKRYNAKTQRGHREGIPV